MTGRAMLIEDDETGEVKNVRIVEIPLAKFRSIDDWEAWLNEEFPDDRAS